MWRFLKSVMLIALIAVTAALGAVGIDKTAVPGAGGMAIGLVAAAAGLAIGLVVAWLRGIAWHQLPAMMRVWRAGLVHRCAWVGVGCVSLAVLIYY